MLDLIPTTFGGGLIYVHYQIIAITERVKYVFSLIGLVVNVIRSFVLKVTLKVS